MWRRTLILAGVSLLASLDFALGSGPARAATATAPPFAVTAAVQATCTVAATTMAFGVYTGLVATATSTITVPCTNTAPYNVGLNPGVATGATVTTRKMTLAAVTLNYVLTSDAAHAVNWGQTIGTDTVAGTGNGVAQPITVFGQVAAGQFITPDAYTDTVTATITY